MTDTVRDRLMHDALPGDLRDDILERLRALDFAGHYDEVRFQYIADTILALIQTERTSSLIS